ncbi:MAG: hypothetical protein ACI9I0_001887 [Rhodoferax sp.]
MVGGVTRTGRAQDVAAVLACQARLSDTIYASGAFPYDLPFYVQTHKPLVMLEDWPALRINTGDGWQRELFEGADFDPQAAQVLQPRSVLAPAGLVAGNWFVVRPHHDIAKGLPGWTLYYQGAGWLLYQSAQPLAAKSPVPTEQKGLPGCKDQGRQ